MRHTLRWLPRVALFCLLFPTGLSAQSKSGGSGMQTQTGAATLTPQQVAQTVASYRCRPERCYRVSHDFSIRVTSVKGTQPGNVEIFGTSFLLAARSKIPCSPSLLGLLSRTGRLVMSPFRSVDYCSITVQADETIRAGAGTIKPREYRITGKGKWGDEVSIKREPSVDRTRAGGAIVVNRWEKTRDGTLLISGTLTAYGARSASSATESSLVFSHAGLLLRGSGVDQVTVSWGASMQSYGVAFGNDLGSDGTVLRDPISLRILDRQQKVKTKNNLYNVAAELKGNGTFLDWSSNGRFRMNAGEANVKVKIANGTSKSGQVKLTASNSKIAGRQATGVLKATQLPQVGVATLARTAQRTQTRATAASATLKTSVPAKQDLTIKIPALGRGETFELRLGGGGSQSRL